MVDEKGRQVDLVTGKLYESTFDSGGASTFGQYAHSSSDTNNTYIECEDFDTTNWEGVTLAAVVEHRGGIALQSGIISRVSAGNFAGEWNLSRESGTTIRFRGFYDGGGTCNITAADGDVLSLVATSEKGGTGRQALRSVNFSTGERQESIGTSNGSAVAAIAENYVGYYSRAGGRSYSKPIYFAAIWDRELTQAEAKSIAERPYQLIKHRNPYIVSLGAVGGGVSGTAIATIDAITGSAAGSFYGSFTGTGSALVAPVTADSAGVLSYVGAVSADLAASMGSAVGTFSTGATGSAAASLQNVLANASGILSYTGSGAADLPVLIGSASGVFTTSDFSGAASAVLSAISASGSGVLSYTGSAAASIEAITASGNGSFSAAEFIGAAASVLEAVSGEASGTFSGGFTGEGDAQLVAVTSAATGKLIYSGTAEGLLAEVIALGNELAPVGSIQGFSNLILISGSSNLTKISN